ncbi:MAG TPA: winged helix-turn-helix transcriptional regulator [Candidatus Thermoplasmatota archaeon]|nr:winged helix-turn-helix transcriptional regulator [Candidatus Thermoplasmatota archaeon]
MRTPTFAALALALLAAAPAAAQGDVSLHVAVGGASPGANARADAAQADAAAPAEVPVEAPDLPAPDLVELTSVKADTAAGAGPVGFYAKAEAAVEKGAEAVADLAPVVTEHAPEVVATAGVLALLQAMGIWRFLGLGAVGLYSRLTRSDLLDNQHRDRVYKLIQETPGLGVSEISKETGLGWGTTVYHLDRLERAGFVASERGGLHKCYYPVGTVRPEARKGMGALKADTTRSIAEYLLARPGATQTELCKDLNLSPSQASKQVSKLEEAGLVRREREWKTVRLIPTEPLSNLLAPEPAAPAPGPAPGVVAPLAA